MLYFDSASSTPILPEIKQFYASLPSVYPISNSIARIKISNILKIEAYKLLFLNSGIDTFFLIYNTLRLLGIKDFFILNNLSEDILRLSKLISGKITSIQTLKEDIEGKHPKALIFSATDYLTGKFCLKKINSITKKNNTILIADLSLTLGKMDINYEKSQIDIGFIYSEQFYSPPGTTLIIDFKDYLKVSDFHDIETKNTLNSTALSIGLQWIFNKKYYVKYKTLHNLCFKELQTIKPVHLLYDFSEKHNPFILSFKVDHPNPELLYIKIQMHNLMVYFHRKQQIFRLSFSLEQTEEKIKQCVELLRKLIS